MADTSNIVPFNKPSKRAERTWLIVLLALLFGGMALLIGGEWGPSTGTAGLAMHACQGVGMIMFGASMAMTSRFLFVKHRVETTGTAAALDARTRSMLRDEYASELAKLAPAAAAYAGCALLFLIGVATIENETAVSFVIMLACCVAAVALGILVHRRRKRRGVVYKHLSSAGLVAFCLVFALLGIYIGWDISSEAALDAFSGPTTVRCFYRDYDIDRHTGRYAGLHPAKLELAFSNVSGNGAMPDPVVYVGGGDADAVLDQVFRGDSFAIELTYYPNCNVFVSAEPA